MMLPSDWQTCSRCNGSGQVEILRGPKAGQSRKCPKCKGKGGWYIMAGLAMVGIIITLTILYAFK